MSNLFKQAHHIARDIKSQRPQYDYGLCLAMAFAELKNPPAFKEEFDVGNFALLVLIVVAALIVPASLIAQLGSAVGDVLPSCTSVDYNQWVVSSIVRCAL